MPWNKASARGKAKDERSNVRVDQVLKLPGADSPRGDGGKPAGRTLSFGIRGSRVPVPGLTGKRSPR